MLETARDSFNLLLSVGAGTGLLYLLRWFWWRINAWSEIAAMASSFVLAAGLFVAGRSGFTFPAHQSLLLTVVVTTAIWVAVAWMTTPTDRRVLQEFYRHVRPAGPGWAAVRRECGDLAPSEGFGFAVRRLGQRMRDRVHRALRHGAFLLGNGGWALVFGAIFVVSTGVLARVVRQTWTN